VFDHDIIYHTIAKISIVAKLLPVHQNQRAEAGGIAHWRLGHEETIFCCGLTCHNQCITHIALFSRVHLKTLIISNGFTHTTRRDTICLDYLFCAFAYNPPSVPISGPNKKPAYCGRGVGMQFLFYDKMRNGLAQRKNFTKPCC
jgi:hypothetical protein